MNTNEPVAWMQKLQNSVTGETIYTVEKIRIGINDIPLYTHPANLTDEKIMEVFTAYEQMQEYGYVGKKPFQVSLGWSLSERNDCLMLARAILRKAQEK